MPWVGWLVTMTLFLYVVGMMVKWGTTRHPPQLIGGWAQDARTSIKRKGYLLIPTLIAAYAGIYSILEARHERRANRALFERSTFMSMVASGNRGTFIAAMKTFGPVQTMAVPGDPELLAPWTWLKREWPNEDPLHMWAVSFFPLCTAETCGNPEAQPKPWRIDLRQADLSDTVLADTNLRDADLYNADLRGADLSDVDLRGANLVFTILYGADLSDADLRGADLTHPPSFLRQVARAGRIMLTVPQPPLDTSRGADLTGATLNKTRLQEVDLRKIFGLTQAQLNTACVDDLTQLPDGLTRPASCRPARRSK